MQPTYGDRAPVEVTIAWLKDLYAKQIARSADPSPWKRGQRAFLTLTGDLQMARKVAAELAARPDEQHALDVIYLAIIDRALGNRAAYDRLMNDCPAPDAQYLLRFGAPARPVKYCEDVVAEFARAVRDQLGNAPAARQFAQMHVETNRVPSSTLGVMVGPPSDKRETRNDLDDWFSSFVHQEEDAIAKMDKVQREEAGARLNGKIGCMCVNFQEAIELTLLRPWHEGGAAQLIYRAHMDELADPEKETYVRHLLGDFIASRAASGPNANEWKRSLRAFYLFTGDYTRARDFSRELIKTSQPPYAIRDSVLLGLTERLLGNTRPLDEAIANCPGTPAEEIDRHPDEEVLHNGDYCRKILNLDLMRAIYIADEKPVPHAFKEMLAENATKASSFAVREFALEQFTRVDPDAAAALWRGLVDGSNVPEWGKEQAFLQLAKIAEKQKQWNDGIRWIDRYIDATSLPSESFTADAWDAIARQEEVVGGIDETYDLKLRLALGAHDFETARRTIEDLAAHGEPRYVVYVRSGLLKLANAEIDAGKREEPLRILGYVSRSVLSTMTSSLLADSRKRLAGTGEKRELQRENSPWDSQSRKPRRVTQPSPAVSKS